MKAALIIALAALLAGCGGGSEMPDVQLDPPKCDRPEVCR